MLIPLSGPIVVMILEGENAILINRKIMGATDPNQAEENTIRKLFGLSIDKKFCTWIRFKRKMQKKR